MDTSNAPDTSWVVIDPTGVPNLPSLQLQSMGFFPRKTAAVATRFTHFAIGIVSRGEGFFHVNTTRTSVRAPCVFIVGPGPDFHYGPQAGTSWRERYIALEGPRVEEWSHLGWLKQMERPRSVDSKFMLWLEKEHQAIAEAVYQTADVVAAKLRLENLVYALYLHLTAWDEAAASMPVANLIDRWRTNPPENVDLPEVARRVGLSYSHFRAEFRRLSGQSPAAFLRAQRLDEAARKLALGQCTIQEAAYDAGYRHLESFYRAFTQFKGVAPGQLIHSLKALQGYGR